MEQEIKVSYEKVDDILYIGREEKVKFSVDVSLPSGDVVVDIGFDGLVKGVEIMNASSFFALSKEEIDKIKAGKLNVVYGLSYVAISISLIGAQKPILSNVVIPYNRKLALAA